jgi:hypothetical protein
MHAIQHSCSSFSTSNCMMHEGRAQEGSTAFVNTWNQSYHTFNLIVRRFTSITDAHKQSRHHRCTTRSETDSDTREIPSLEVYARVGFGHQPLHPVKLLRIACGGSICRQFFGYDKHHHCPVSICHISRTQLVAFVELGSQCKIAGFEITHQIGPAPRGDRQGGNANSVGGT